MTTRAKARIISDVDTSLLTFWQAQMRGEYIRADLLLKEYDRQSRKKRPDENLLDAIWAGRAALEDKVRTFIYHAKGAGQLLTMFE